MIYVISRNPAIADKVKAALKTAALIEVPDASGFLAQVLPRAYSKEACVLVDLATVSDAEHLISFTKSSATISKLPIVILGSEQNIDALPRELLSVVSGIITAPYTAGEIAAVVASICEQQMPPLEPPPAP